MVHFIRKAGSKRNFLWRGEATVGKGHLDGRRRGISWSSFDHCGNLLRSGPCHLHGPEKNLQATAESPSLPQVFQLTVFATVMFLGFYTF